MLAFLDAPARKLINNPEKLISASGIKPGMKVLEIGCGSGFFTVSASKIPGDNGKLYSTDFHPVAVEETLKKVKVHNLTNVIVIQDDAQQSKFENAFFDLIILYDVVPAPVISIKQVVEEAHRILKQNGTLALWPFRVNAFIKNGLFEKIDKKNGVYRFRRI